MNRDPQLYKDYQDNETREHINVLRNNMPNPILLEQTIYLKSASANLSELEYCQREVNANVGLRECLIKEKKGKTGLELEFYNEYLKQTLILISWHDQKHTQLLKDAELENRLQDLQTEPKELEFEPRQKLILLHELGVVDFLRTKQPYNTAPSNIGRVLGKAIGMNEATASRYVNAMIENDIDQNNLLKDSKGNQSKNLKSIRNWLAKNNLNAD